MTSRLKALLAVLAAVSVMGLVAQFQARAIQADISRIAEAAADNLHDHYTRYGKLNGYRAVEVCATGSGYKRFVLFGETRGTVAVYVRYRDRQNQERVFGVRFYYMREGDQWRLLESGACDHAEAAEEARALFAKSRR